ncbi:SufD family Fe-S cluster assembly protein, partial [candidate division KSB1 bacterium]|nr:SufD family Fe-S cluster assembly protein [candidate division KSB1 bacterium]
VPNLEAGANYFLTHRSNAENDAKTLTVIASLGSKMTKANFGISLTGRGSESELEGFLLGEKRQHFDHHTIHDHLASNTLSKLNFKVVLKDRASSAYTGKIIIGHEAPFSEAYQENRNLLLSPKCRVDSIPELEINQDEVRCSHGAAMGPPDENQLFYLRSRGIPQSEAIQLIAEGFMEDALQRIPEDLKEHLRNYISVRLHGDSTIG